MTRPEDSEPLAPIVEIHRDGHDRADSLLETLREKSAVGDPRDDDDLLEQLSSALPNPPLVFRTVVAVIAIAQLVLVLPWLIASDPFGLLGDSTGSHLTRDGALGLVVALAALLTAWRPRYALPSFMLASAALLAQTAAGLLEHTSTAGVNEFIHLPSVALACMIGFCGIRLRDLKPVA